AAGQTFRGACGASLKIVEAARDTSGTTTLRVQVVIPSEITPASASDEEKAAVTTLPPPLPPPGGAALALQGVMGCGNTASGLELLDEKGSALPWNTVRVEAQSDGAATTRDYTFVCRQEKDAGEPARLTFTGTRSVTITIPFSLKDVPLP